MNVASTESVLRALYGYFFLVFIVRIVGRRPGKQLTPFEFILIFFLGGLMLTAIVADEASLTNAFCQIIAVAFAHFSLAAIRSRSDRVARILDGTPLILLEGNTWRALTMRRQRIADDDVMEKARDQGLKTLEEIETAVLERNGEISILPKEDS
ncbi:MAG TPA: YetF domain-containing protein [Acidobacteriaceae bacterium]|nr:YetF domain-containing protein [Acidobacteriaceae bacterium]